MRHFYERLPVILPVYIVVVLCCFCEGETSKDFQDFEPCGYHACNPVKEGMLNVHIVPNTHDDVGWVKTVKQYYDQEVSLILPSVVQALRKDRENRGNKRFIYVEMAFMSRWWKDIDRETKKLVRELVDGGRLEIILGGWTMIDEATTYYLDIIDQHTIGFEFIRHTFGACGRPRIGWQIDPFGHSREVASLFSQFGFDGMFVGRVDYQDKEQRQKTKTMEFIWNTSESLVENSNIFTGVLANVYWPPHGFCWDSLCTDDELIRSTESEKQEMVRRFLSVMTDWASNFDTNHVMVEMGGDFNYIDADKWFDNLDELIKLANKNHTDGSDRTVNLLYSTPSCYLYQLYRANKTWTTKADDFFPYAHRAHSFWTGYFTSRPNFKFLVRKAGAFLQACKQIAALSLLDRVEPDLQPLKEAMAVVQHHDAVSGTEKQYVVEDYTRLLLNGINYCKPLIQRAFDKFMALYPNSRVPVLEYCLDLDIAECRASHESDQFSVILYNPLAHAYPFYVRIPVKDLEYRVVDSFGEEIEHQTLEISVPTHDIPRRFSKTWGLELVFKVDLPPLGYTTAFVSSSKPTYTTSDEEVIEEEFIELVEEDIGPEPILPVEEVIENKFYSISVDKRTGHMVRLWNKEEDVAISLKQSFYYYTGFEGHNYTPETQASGAYIFRPKKGSLTQVSERRVRIESFKGSQVQEIRQIFCKWVSQVIRIYTDKPYVELEWTVGPLPSSGFRSGGKEVITKYMTDMATDGEFYTDLNGRETLKRRRNHRETWTFNNTEPESGNYFPITSRASIKDERRNLQFTVLVDRSEGVSSLHDGHLEIMVHRRTFYDDSLGVTEPLEETGPGRQGIVARGRHLLLLNRISKAAAAYRQIYPKFYLQPLIMFSTKEADVTDWVNLYRTKWSGMVISLPNNVNLLTLEPWSRPLVPTEHVAFLLRLEHIFEKFEDETLAGPQLIDLQKLFTPFEIVEAIELSLGANMKKEDMHKLKWRADGDKRPPMEKKSHRKDRSLVKQLAPMEIKTFQINVKIIH